MLLDIDLGAFVTLAALLGLGLRACVDASYKAE